MPTLERDGASIFWDTTGPEGAPTLVMVHGSWSDSSDFTAFAPVMAGPFRVVTFDRRGHGRSTEPRGAGLAADDVADLAAVIEAQGAGPVHVFGHSFGGVLALKLAAGRPDLVARVAIHQPPLVQHLDPDSAVSARTREAAGRVIELILSGEQEAAARLFIDEMVYTPGSFDAMRDEARAMLTRNARTFLGEMQDPDGTRMDFATLDGFDRPAMVTRGTASPEMFHVIADQVERALPNARREAIDGAGHSPHMTHSGHYAALLSEFFGAG